jgi:hypothetical protein
MRAILASSGGLFLTPKSPTLLTEVKWKLALCGMTL